MRRIHSESLHSWKIIVARMIKPYFTSQYKVEPDSITKTINGQVYTVYRNNHGLHHGIRQSLLALEIVRLLVESQPDSPISQWIINQDEDFEYKLCMVAAFQRTGRQSEMGKQHSMELYTQYIKDDAENFYSCAKPYRDNFRNNQEILDYADALLWPLRNEHNYLEKILSVSHKLDLRRINSFNGERIKKMINKTLKGYDSSITEELWRISGKFLKATGDRDMVLQRPYQSKFFIIAHDPDQIVNNICNAMNVKEEDYYHNDCILF